jgi:hypothetical protein
MVKNVVFLPIVALIELAVRNSVNSSSCLYTTFRIQQKHDQWTSVATICRTRLTNRGTPMIFSPIGNTIVNLFSSVADVWVPGAKTTGPIVKKFVFS